MSEPMTWKEIDLCGATSVARVCNEYEFHELKKVPGTKFRIKVLERTDGGYIALPNVAVRGPDGYGDGRAGLGRTEAEALQNAVRAFMDDIAALSEPTEASFEWSDPSDF